MYFCVWDKKNEPIHDEFKNSIWKNHGYDMCLSWKPNDNHGVSFSFHHENIGYAFWRPVNSLQDTVDFDMTRNINYKCENFIQIIGETKKWLRIVFFYRLSVLFGVNEETFLRCTRVVLEAIVDKISYLISWPNRSGYRRIARKFNDIGKYV